MKNTKETIRKFVNYLNNPDKDGGYWLPNIQRPFVWKEEQMERLFDSILREYPIGTLLVWKTKSNIRRRKFIDNYNKNLRLTDFYITEDDKPKMLVLDGQQRLQSLFIGLKGSYEKKELAINILSGDLVSPDDIKYKFKFMLSKEIKAPWVKFKDIVFSNKEYNKISKDIISLFDVKLEEEQVERIETVVAKIVRLFSSEENIVSQEVDSIDNPELYSEEEIVEIFIRANSGGTPLGKSDLLFSLLTASWDEADEKMGDLLDEINKNGYAFTRDFILKTCLSLLGKGAQYNVAKFRDESTRDKIIDEWENISNAIKDVKDFVYGKTFIKTDRCMPSYLVLIPLIYFRYQYPKKWNKASKIEEYLLRTLLSGAFSGSPDTLIDKCTKKIDETNSFDVDEIFDLIKSEGRNLEITKDHILSQQYGGKLIHLLFNLWYDFNYQPSYYNNTPSVDHIFPQSVLRKIKKENPRNGKKNLLKYDSFMRDQIANCMLLTIQENGSGGKSDTLPEEWFKGKDESYLELHLIPKDLNLLKVENYDQFIEERKKLILKEFDYLIIK